MGVKVTNNAFGILASAITNVSTTITLSSGDGAKFPVLASGDFFFGTLINTANQLEIVKVTARSTNTLTVIRGQDGTTARAYSAGDRFELRPTAAMFEAFTEAESISYDNTASGISANNVQTAIDTKQATLVSGTNIKTVNGDSILGSGNIVVGSEAQDAQIYTSPGTWSKPATVKRVKVTVVGGGGGGQGGKTRASPFLQHTGGHGGGGGAAIAWVPAPSIPGPVSVTVGAGGAAGANLGPAFGAGFSTTGGVGGTSSFGAFLSATGGAAGTGGFAAGVPGPAGVGTGPGINCPGGRSLSIGRSADKNQSILCQSSLYLAPGFGDGQAGVGIGEGGTGCLTGPGSHGGQGGRGNARGGGAGVDGVVIVEEFY